MKRGFTLIELLVVIAIIAILAAILFPVFARAKLAAKKTVDLSSQKQVATASALYLADFDDRLFFYGSTNSPSVSRTGAIIPNAAAVNPIRWWNALMPYLKNTQILRAPDDELPTLSADPTGAKTIARSYIALRPAEGLVSTQIPSVATTMILTQKWGKSANGTPITDSWIEPFNGDFDVDPITGRMALAANRYFNGINASFFDGHAKWQTAGTVNASADLTGCTLVHLFPVGTQMCDQSVPGCAAVVGNVCNDFIYP